MYVISPNNGLGWWWILMIYYNTCNAGFNEDKLLKCIIQMYLNYNELCFIRDMYLPCAVCCK